MKRSALLVTFFLLTGCTWGNPDYEAWMPTPSPYVFYNSHYFSTFEGQKDLQDLVTNNFDEANLYAASEAYYGDVIYFCVNRTRNVNHVHYRDYFICQTDYAFETFDILYSSGIFSGDDEHGYVRKFFDLKGTELYYVVDGYFTVLDVSNGILLYQSELNPVGYGVYENERYAFLYENQIHTLYRNEEDAWIEGVYEPFYPDTAYLIGFSEDNVLFFGGDSLIQDGNVVPRYEGIDFYSGVSLNDTQTEDALDVLADTLEGNYRKTIDEDAIAIVRKSDQSTQILTSGTLAGMSPYLAEGYRYGGFGVKAALEYEDALFLVFSGYKSSRGFYPFSCFFRYDFEEETLDYVGYFEDDPLWIGITRRHIT